MSEPDMDAVQGQDTPADTPGDAPSQYLFSLAGAAVACGVSRTTIRRRLDKGEFPNAKRLVVPGEPEQAAAWRIPAADLVAAGLVPNRVPGQGEDTPGDMDAPPMDTGGEQGGTASLSATLDPGAPVTRGELDALRARVADLERLAEAERRTAEAERRRADDLARVAEAAQQTLDLALRRLGPAEQTEPAPQVPQEATTGPQAAPDGGEEAKPSPGFWSRLFRGEGA